jgi:hypothetical protein
VKKKTAIQILNAGSPKPDTAHDHIGIEIEFFCTKDEMSLAKLFADSDVSAHVSLGGDGSIEPYVDKSPPECFNCGSDSDLYPTCGCGFTKYYTAYELRILCKQSERKKVISKVCRILRSVHARVNDSCGLHVHLDMRGRSQRDKETSFRSLYNILDMMAKVVEPSRLESEYCLLNESPYLVDNNDRYSAINSTALRKYNTLEVRLHHGTISARDLIHWSDLLVHAAEAELLEPLSDIKTVAEKLALSRYAYNHFKKKEHKFRDAS